MIPNRTPRGATLIEAMIAMAILMIGASGLAATNHQSALVLGDSQRLTRATVVARDLISQIETWDFDDPRLSNADASNDGDIGDSAAQFMALAAPPADHGEGDLAGGGGWNGLPSSYVTDAGMERYFNIAYVDDANGNGVWDAVRIAVIVRWPQGGAWRRVVFPFVKSNPADVR
jgi:hypothetical protein